MIGIEIQFITFVDHCHLLYHLQIETLDQQTAGHYSTCSKVKDHKVTELMSCEPSSNLITRTLITPINFAKVALAMSSLSYNIFIMPKFDGVLFEHQLTPKTQTKRA